MEDNKLEESNRSKYGPKEFDQISTNYRISNERGNIWFRAIFHIDFVHIYNVFAQP